MTGLINFPNNWLPRSYQKSYWDFLDGGGLRSMVVAHRRWGKDDVALHKAACAIHERPATYWHCLPLQSQARKAIWTAVNPRTGMRRIDEAFPPEVRKRTNDNDMFIEFINGGTWQVIGSDRYDSLVGSGVAGVTFSEWALANPSAWAYIRPMLEENGGWATFITTPRGNNHAAKMAELAARSNRWYFEVSNVDKTGVFTASQLAETLEEYQSLYGLEMGLAVYRQEYDCSFSGAVVGSYLGGEIARAEREGRIRRVGIDRRFPVHSVMDLGKASNNPIWFFQVINDRIRIVDFYTPQSEDLADWVEWMDERDYHGIDFVPHDIMVTEWGSSRTRAELLRDAGRRPRRIPRVSVADGLQAARTTINEALFDRNKRVMRGIEGLKNFRRSWDDEKKTFSETPVKDWAEHIGSAFRYLGLAWKAGLEVEEDEDNTGETELILNPDGTIAQSPDVMEFIKRKERERRNG